VPRPACPVCDQSPCQCSPDMLIDIVRMRHKHSLDSAGWPMDM
jgi:hypothetical protein